MLKVGTDVADKMLLFVVFILCPIAFAEAVADAQIYDLAPQPCEQKCGCEERLIYDAVNNRCRINFMKLRKTVVVYGKSDIDSFAGDEMAKSIYIEGEELFKGITISVIFFMVCASVCVVAACIYCCRINYTDRTLKKNVKAVAKKQERDYSSKKMGPKRVPLPPISESCSVFVEPAGVMVV